MFQSEHDIKRAETFWSVILEPNQRVKFNDNYYLLRKIDHLSNNPPIGMLWVCKEENPSVAVGAVNVFSKTTYFGDMSNIISNVEDNDNLLRLYKLRFPHEFEHGQKKTFWQKLKALFS
jgi:hypothetical protein